MVTKFADQLTEGYYKVAKLINDKASLLTKLNYLNLLLQFSKLEQIFLTGDIQQPPPYSGSLPESVKQIEHNSCLENLISRKATISINLRYSYRSYPTLTNIISTVLYDSELEAALSNQDRKMWKSLGFPELYDSTPVLFLDIPGQECKTLLRSWTNEQKNETALLIAQKLQTRLPGKLTTLCYYSSALRDLKICEPSLWYHTVDFYMGKETDVVLLLTTRSNAQLTEEARKFLFDKNWLTVALTRAKEGFIILGNQRVLKRSSLWSNLLFELFKRIQIVSFDEFVDYLNRYCFFSFLLLLLLLACSFLFFGPRECRWLHWYWQGYDKVVNL